MDAPMLNIYFAGITLKLIQANIITVEQIHESFSLDTMIDKKFKKDQIFGRRADYLANLIKLDNTVSCDPTLFLLEDANAEDWRAHYVTCFLESIKAEFSVFVVNICIKKTRRFDELP